MAAVPADRWEGYLEAWRNAHEDDRPVRTAEGMLRMLNGRLSSIGGSVANVKGRVSDDNARGRVEFGESAAVHWN